MGAAKTQPLPVNISTPRGFDLCAIAELIAAVIGFA